MLARKRNRILMTVLLKPGQRLDQERRIKKTDDSPTPLMSAMDMARFSRPSNMVTIQLRKIGMAVQIPAPPKQMKAYLETHELSFV